MRLDDPKLDKYSTHNGTRETAVDCGTQALETKSCLDVDIVWEGDRRDVVDVDDEGQGNDEGEGRRVEAT